MDQNLVKLLRQSGVRPSVLLWAAPYILSARHSHRTLFPQNFGCGKTDSRAADQICIIFHELLQFIHQRNQLASVHPIPEAAASMKQYLDNHFQEKVRIDDLTRLVYLSHSQVIRLFRASFGITPLEYVESRRLESARIMLKNTSLPVREIAERCGFSDEHYFSGYFKKRTGMSPRTYRS